MDRVRFGRALGTGARAAAKSLMSAAEAAAAPAPQPTPQRSAASAQPTIQPPVRPAAAAPRVTLPDARQVAGQARNLKRSIFTPLARYSSVLWLEVTGLFFGIFAFILGNQVWKQRGALHLPAQTSEAQHFYVYCVLFALFSYFTASSFIRAKRRQRR